MDKSGVNINMIRKYGYAIGKERVYNYVPLNRPKSTTLLSSICMDSTMVHKEFSGAVNREHFLDYVTNPLTPLLHSGNIVIIHFINMEFLDTVLERW